MSLLAWAIEGVCSSDDGFQSLSTAPEGGEHRTTIQVPMECADVKKHDTPPPTYHVVTHTIMLDRLPVFRKFLEWGLNIRHYTPYGLPVISLIC